MTPLSSACQRIARGGRGFRLDAGRRRGPYRRVASTVGRVLFNDCLRGGYGVLYDLPLTAKNLSRIIADLPAIPTARKRRWHCWSGSRRSAFHEATRRRF